MSSRPAPPPSSWRSRSRSTPTCRLVSGDSERLQQVIWNLLANAVKFTRPGGTIRLEIARVGPNVRLSVRDTGQGISPDFLPYVFDRFRQADASASRRHGGLGLGLALVRQIVELHGGAVGVDSRGVKQGTTFWVTLPAVSGIGASRCRPRRRRNRSRSRASPS